LFLNHTYSVAGQGDLEKIIVSEPEQVCTGFLFTEGPIWHPAGYLLFSDIPGNKIFKWNPDDNVETFREPSGNSNGLTYDLQGRLIACEHDNRRISRAEHDSSITVLADRYDGKRLNSPNDAVVKSNGSIYFTDPPFGVSEDLRELDIQGVYRLDPDGKLILLVENFDRPNGLAFSPDEKVLYIDDSRQKHVRAFDVTNDGILTNGRIFINMASEKDGVPDGMKVDVEGNLYVTGPGGTWIISPTGEHLGTIITPELPANCAFGDWDNKTLYITARTSVYRVRLKIPGTKIF